MVEAASRVLMEADPGDVDADTGLALIAWQVSSRLASLGRPDQALDRAIDGRRAYNRYTPVRVVVVEDVIVELTALAKVVAAGEVMQDIAHQGSLESLDEQVFGRKVAHATGLVPVSRLRYESPVEIVLTISGTIGVAGVGVRALIYIIKRLYNAELEINTSHEEHRAAFLRAKRQVLELEGHDVPKGWAVNMPDAVDAATGTKHSTQLELEEIVLVEGSEHT